MASRRSDSSGRTGGSQPERALGKSCVRLRSLVRVLQPPPSITSISFVVIVRTKKEKATGGQEDPADSYSCHKASQQPNVYPIPGTEETYVWYDGLARNIFFDNYNDNLIRASWGRETRGGSVR